MRAQGHGARVEQRPGHGQLATVVRHAAILALPLVQDERRRQRATEDEGGDRASRPWRRHPGRPAGRHLEDAAAGDDVEAHLGSPSMARFRRVDGVERRGTQAGAAHAGAAGRLREPAAGHVLVATTARTPVCAKASTRPASCSSERSGPSFTHSGASTRPPAAPQSSRGQLGRLVPARVVLGVGAREVEREPGRAADRPAKASLKKVAASAISSRLRLGVVDARADREVDAPGPRQVGGMAGEVGGRRAGAGVAQADAVLHRARRRSRATATRPAVAQAG